VNDGVPLSEFNKTNCNVLKFYAKYRRRIYIVYLNSSCVGQLKDQSSNLKPYEKKDIFGKIMKDGAFFAFTACSESL
jgi:hypothetical protein